MTTTANTWLYVALAITVWVGLIVGLIWARSIIRQDAETASKYWEGE